MTDFVAAWKAHIRPLREALGFEVAGGWVVEDENVFVWVITYRGDGTFEQANRAYYESPLRTAVDPNPAEWIEEPTQVMATEVE